MAAYGKGVFDFGILNTNISRKANVFSAHGMQDGLSEQYMHQYWGYSQFNVSLESKHNNRDMLRYFTAIHLSDLNEMTENNYSFESLITKRFGAYDYSAGFKADLYTNNTATDMAFASDPEWLEKRAATEADGQIVASVNNQILMPTKF